MFNIILTPRQMVILLLAFSFIIGGTILSIAYVPSIAFLSFPMLIFTMSNMLQLFHLKNNGYDFSFRKIKIDKQKKKIQRIILFSKWNVVGVRFYVSDVHDDGVKIIFNHYSKSRLSKKSQQKLMLTLTKDLKNHPKYRLHFLTKNAKVHCEWL